MTKEDLLNIGLEQRMHCFYHPKIGTSLRFSPTKSPLYIYFESVYLVTGFGEDMRVVRELSSLDEIKNILKTILGDEK
jgi:hypothetical protein